jgi:hypothetical protein
MFQVIFTGPHGPTVNSDNPKIDAYKQAAMIQNTLGRRYSLTAHEDGAYTVAGDGLEPITFQPEDTPAGSA